MGRLRMLSKIRVRLVLGFLAAFCGMALFGVLSYIYFAQIEHRLVFLSQADSMLNTVLEVRRYEKNYFLYHHEKDYQQARIYLSEFEALLGEQGPHLRRGLGAAGFELLLANVTRFDRSFEQAHQMLGGSLAGGERPRELVAAIGELRTAGQQIISGCEVLARQERQAVRTLLRQYRPVMVAFLVCLAGLGGLVAYGLIVRLVRPLKVIEEAARDVGRGEFRVIPWSQRRDEIGDVVHAFNRMVTQLRQNNEQMIQTEKLTSLGTLTSGVAHELNNPLNNISTSTQILLEELDPGVSEYHRELLMAIEQQVTKAKDIVGSLLEFARQREFRLRREDLRSVIEETLKLIKGEIPARVEVELDAPAGIAMDMDKAHMVQALINLIINAIQAMDGAGRLTITARQLTEQGQARLEVADSGPGMSAEVLPRIFDPFFTTKEVGRGTGLGLSITYGIVERHHGRIHAESEPGHGARFVMTMPLRAQED